MALTIQANNSTVTRLKANSEAIAVYTWTVHSMFRLTCMPKHASGNHGTTMMLLP
jgi:hypothetical protein